MTPAHSDGTAVFSSLRQLATRASRSTVSTPVAVASAAAWFASGERMELAGIDWGAGAMFMPHFTHSAAVVQPGKTAASIGLRGQMAVLGKVAEPGELTLERQFDHAGRAVALLADDDFSLAVHQ